MKIAIPLFGAYVAPRFDSAERFLLVTLNGTKLLQKEEVTVPVGPYFERLNRILEFNPDIVICGNIDGFCWRMIAARGIRVIPRIMGEPEKVVRRVLNSQLENVPEAVPDAIGRKRLGIRCGRRKGRKGRYRKQERIKKGGMNHARF